MYLSQPTLLRKGRILEVVFVNRKIRPDVIADHLQPMALLIGKLPLSALLLP